MDDGGYGLLMVVECVEVVVVVVCISVCGILVWIVL